MFIPAMSTCRVSLHVQNIPQMLVLLEVLALQGIPDEYDEADINRLFSGTVLHIPLACCSHLCIILS